MSPARFFRILLIGASLWGGFLLGSAGAQEAPPPKQVPPDFLPGQVLVRFRIDAPLSRLKEIVEAANVSIERELSPWGLYLVTFHESRPVEKVLEILRTFPEVLYAEPDYKLQAFSEQIDTTESGTVAGQAARAMGFPIAIIDAGFSLSDPGLANHLFKNHQEIPGDGVDNDGNGYVDDFEGYDFYRHNGDPAGVGPFKSHGTEVVHAVLARGENAELLLLPLRAGPGPWLATSAICEALTYALARGAQVITLNFGGWWGSRSLAESIAYAAERKAVLVASAGDEVSAWSNALDTFPRVVWVAATKKKRWKARFFLTNPWQVSELVLPDLSNAIAHGLPGKNSLTDHHTVSSVEGRVGKAAQFERAKAQYLTAPDDPDLSMGDSDFTVAAWVYLEGRDEMVIVSKGDSSRSHSNEYLLVYNPVHRVFEFTVANKAAGSRSVGSYGTGTPSVGNWHWVVAWYHARSPSPNTISIQVDNGPSDTLELEGISGFRSHYEFSIGSFSNFHQGGGGYMNGRIDEVGVWKRLLTPEERTDLYNNGLGDPYQPGRHSFLVDRQGTLPKELVAYYPFDESKRLWRFGTVTVAPFSFLGFFGLGLFLYSSACGIRLLFLRQP